MASDHYSIKAPLLFERTIFADDIDFVSRDADYLEHVHDIAQEVFLRWDLSINVSKTERTAMDHDSDDWYGIKKLGSKLDTEVDIDHRIRLSNAAFARMKCLRIYCDRMSVALRVRIYKTYVLPLLQYNMGTWALNTTLESKLDVHHRGQLKKLLKIKRRDHLSNKRLYELANSKPL